MKFPLKARRAPSRPRPPSCRGFAITVSNVTFVRTSLEEWSIRRRDLYLITHDIKTDINAPDGIRSRNPSKLAAAHPRLRKRGYRGRRSMDLVGYIRHLTSYRYCRSWYIKKNCNPYFNVMKYMTNLFRYVLYIVFNQGKGQSHQAVDTTVLISNCSTNRKKRHNFPLRFFKY